MSENKRHQEYGTETTPELASQKLAQLQEEIFEMVKRYGLHSMAVIASTKTTGGGLKMGGALVGCPGCMLESVTKVLAEKVPYVDSIGYLLTMLMSVIDRTATLAQQAGSKPSKEVEEAQEILSRFNGGQWKN